MHQAFPVLPTATTPVLLTRKAGSTGPVYPQVDSATMVGSASAGSLVKTRFRETERGLSRLARTFRYASRKTVNHTKRKGTN